MSRSRKRHPFAPIVGGDSQADDKRIANRIMRRTNRVAVRLGRETFDHVRAVLDEWNMRHDGTKRYRSLADWIARGRSLDAWRRWVLAK